MTLKNKVQDTTQRPTRDWKMRWALIKVFLLEDCSKSLDFIVFTGRWIAPAT